ncbi:MAG: sunset domain-containing protein [Ilumatobacteraceae bacterium]
MMRWLRRLFWLGVLTCAACFAYRALSRRRAGTEASPSSPSVAAPTSTPPPREPSVATPAARWVAPNNGECPAGYPIKVNEDSGIYHVPGGRFYARTAADRCYANADDALADGYRPAKA